MLILLPHSYEQLEHPQFTTGLTLQRNKNKYLEIQSHNIAEC